MEHAVYTTKNTEYTFTAGKCVRVTDRRTGEVKADSPLLGRSVSCAVRFYPGGGVMPVDSIEEGTALCFQRLGDEERSVVTSALVQAPAVSS